MKRLLIAVAFVLFIGGCTDSDNAQRILSQNGYTNISMTGYNFFSCSEGDFYNSGFRALSPDGKHTRHRDRLRRYVF
jgi:hypothetical protein